MSNFNSSIKKRAPIVAIVGHVDHGKSSLLDFIRQSKIVDSEAGGITQHISAYEVNWKTSDGKESNITFLDTPGHAAFQSMRERGAQMADIGILIVSAEDGAKAQTKEAWETLERSGIPVIVAINKVDKPGANIEMTKNSLSEIGVYVETWGGTIPFVPISAKTGAGVDELLDLIVLQADMIDLDYNDNEEAEGVVLESFVDTKRGTSATLVLKKGAIHKGAIIQSDVSISPTRIMENFLGKAVDSAVAGQAIKVTGFDVVPNAGANFKSFDKKKDAEIAQETAKREAQEVRMLDYSHQEFQFLDEDIFVLPIILKTDVLGTLEAVLQEIKNIEIENVKIKIISKGVGPINEKDIQSAKADKNSLVIAFHTTVDKKAREQSEIHGVKIHEFDIIYKLSEWLHEITKDAKPKKEIEEVIGSLKVIRVFNRSKDAQVVGGKVYSGSMKNKHTIQIVRRDTTIGKGRIVELQQFKQPVNEVKEGNECGLMVDSKYDIAEGDFLQVIVKKIV
jgi:translation initiation factor IF-2